MRLEFQDSIDRYLLKRMSEDERCAFEAKCAENQELREQLEHTRDVKAVISERNELLAKFQEWDKELDDNRKDVTLQRRKWIYGISGVAAAVMAGLFLLPTSKFSLPEKGGELISMNSGGNATMPDSTILGTDKFSEESEILLAQNDDVKKARLGNVGSIDEDQVFSFEKNDIKGASLSPENALEQELERITEKIDEVTKELADLEKERANEESDHVFNETSTRLLRRQYQQLRWKKSMLLLQTKRNDEALAILEELRKEGGEYQHKADSVCREMRK